MPRRDRQEEPAHVPVPTADPAWDGAIDIRSPEAIAANPIVPITPIPREVTPYGRLIVPWGTPVEQWPTNLDLTTLAGKADLFNASGQASLGLGADGTIDLLVSRYVAHPSEQVDETTGEVKRFSRLVLITPDGQTFATTSEVVAHRFQQLLSESMFGAGPWPAGIQIRITETKSKHKKRTCHNLTLLVVGLETE